MEGHNREKGEDSNEKRRDDCRGEHPDYQGGPDQELRPIVFEEEHHHRFHRRERLRPGPAREGGAECLPHEVSRRLGMSRTRIYGPGIAQRNLFRAKYVVKGFQNHILLRSLWTRHY